MWGSEAPWVPVVGTGNVQTFESLEKCKWSSLVGTTRAVPEPYCTMINGAATEGFGGHITYVNDCNLTRGQATAIWGSVSPRAECVHQRDGPLVVHGKKLHGSIWGVFVDRARRTYSGQITRDRQTRHILQYALVLWVRNDP